MSVSPREIRTRVAEAIRGADGFKESTWAPDLFGLEPRTLAHLAYAVAVTATGPVTSDRQLARGGRDLEVWSFSTVLVRWSHRNRGDAGRADYDDALDAELVLVAAALSSSLDRTDLDVRFEQVLSREVLVAAAAPGAAPWFVGQVQFRARHQYALATPTT